MNQISTTTRCEIKRHAKRRITQRNTQTTESRKNTKEKTW